MLFSSYNQHTMPVAAGPGRPPKFDEPLITRRFSLPLSLNDKVVERARRNVWDDVEVIRAALNAYFGIATTSTEGTTANDIKTAVREALREERAGMLSVDLTPEEKELLAIKARELGSSPEQFLENLARVAIGKPVEETRDFLMGGIFKKVGQKLKGGRAA